MSERDKAILIRTSKEERALLKRKAKKSGLTLSDFVRQSLIYSDCQTIVTIDTRPLEKLLYELTKQGVNLNQLMHYLNTYGLKGYDRAVTMRVLAREEEMFFAVAEALANLRQESIKNGLCIVKKQTLGEVSEDVSAG